MDHHSLRQRLGPCGQPLLQAYWTGIKVQSCKSSFILGVIDFKVEADPFTDVILVQILLPFFISATSWHTQN